MCSIDRLLEAAELERRFFKAIRAAEGRTKICSKHKNEFAVMYIRGLFIRYKAGERSMGLLEELEGVS